MRPRSPEPKGKLDAMTGYSFSTPVWDGRTWVRPAVAEVAVARTANGPEDRPREQDAPAKWDKCAWPGGRPGVMKCPRGPAGRGRRLDTGALRVRNKFGAGPAGPGIVAASTNPRFG